MSGAMKRPAGFKSAITGVARDTSSNTSISNSLSGIPASRAIASRCKTRLVDPAVAVPATAALRRLAGVTRSRGRRRALSASTVRRPAWNAAVGLSGCTAGMSFRPIGERPRKLIASAIVLAVNWPPQAPAPGQACVSTAFSCSSSIVPAPCAPTASNTSWMVSALPLSWPGMIEPPYRMTLGRFIRTAAIAAAGIVLSQPTMNMTASSE